MASFMAVEGIIIMDSAGSRVCGKYFSPRFTTPKDQSVFEAKLHSKTRSMAPRLEADVIVVEGSLSVFKSGADVVLHVVGSDRENELILVSVLEAFFDALSGLLKGNMDKRAVLDHLDLVLLTIDELVDGGIVLETDSLAIANRVLMKGAGGEAQLTDWAQIASVARESVVRAFAK